MADTNRRTWRSCWCDRRQSVQHASVGLLVIMLVMSIIAISYAADKPVLGEESLSEHSIVIIDVMAYIIVALFTGLVGIVLWNILDMKNTMRAHHEEVKKEFKKYVRIQVHNAICESQIDVEPE